MRPTQHRSSPHPTPLRLTARTLLLLAATMVGCGDSSTGPQEALRAGRYRLIFEIVSSVTIPAPIQGRHEITFRMNEPATTPEDLELVASRRILPEGGTVEDYLLVDPSQLVIEEDRWALRFMYADGGYSVATTLLDLGGGDLTISPGCVARQEGGSSYLAAGCRLDRL